MKLSIDPMPAYRDGAAVKVNAHFANLASLSAMREAAWTRKRQIAQAAKGGAWTDAFEQEAVLRGMSSPEFADLILSKPDPTSLADARELQRQTALLAIDAAKTPAELDAIIKDANG
ncbi:MAG: hypothetical protein WBB98_04560 [Xanthobacteraceae bacterium]